MAECHGEVCTITTYTFKLSTKEIKEAKGRPAKGGSPKDVLEELKNELERSPFFVQELIDKKVEKQEGKSLPKKIVKGPRSEGFKSYKLIDASCGAEGKCLCTQIEGATGKKLDALEKTIRINGLTDTGLKLGGKD